MPKKKTTSGVSYTVTGKLFTWFPLDDDDNRDGLPAVTIPLRIKLKVVRSIAGTELDVDAMFTLLGALIPDQQETLDEMDLNDFQTMFATWQDEYSALSGATLGE